MSAVRYIPHESRLAKLIVAPGGKTMDAAIEDAEAGLETVADACLADIDRLIAELTTRLGAKLDQLDQDETAYVSAREIAGLAAICKRPYLGEAAHSLCVLIDNARTSRRWRPEAVKVHLATLQLLRGIANEGESPMAGQVINSLHNMVRRLADEDNLPAADQ